MNLLTRYNIWKLSACAKRHERQVVKLKKRLIAEIRQLNHEIRLEEHKREVSVRLARKALHKLEQGKSLDWQSKGLESPYMKQQWGFREGIEL